MPSTANFDEQLDIDSILLSSALDLDLYRSGSAPPTIEGSRTAVRTLLGPTNNVISSEEEQLRAHPDYLSYYYNNNLNPRLPPPLMSREDWRASHNRFRGGNSSSSSLFAMQPGESGGAQRSLGRAPSAEWFEQGSEVGGGLGIRRKSFADAAHQSQEDFGRFASTPRHPSRPVSRNAYDTPINSVGLSDAQLAQLHNGMETVDSLHSGALSPGLVRVKSLGSTISQSFASAVGSSLSRSTTPDPQLLGQSSNLCPPPVRGRFIDPNKKITSNGFDGVSARLANSDDLAGALSGLNLSGDMIKDGESRPHNQLHHEFSDRPDMLSAMRSEHNQYMQHRIIKKPESESLNSRSILLPEYNDFSRNTRVPNDAMLSALASNGQINMRGLSSPANLSKNVAAVGSNSLSGSSGYYHTDMRNIDNSNAYLTNQGLPAMLNSQLDEGIGLTSGSEGQYLNRIGSQVGSGFQSPLMDPLYAQYLKRASDSAAQVAPNLSDTSLGRSYLGASHVDIPAYQKVYLEALLAQQKLQYGESFLSESDSLNNGFYGSSGSGLRMPYQTLAPRSPLRQNDLLSRIPSMLRSGTGGSKGPWNHDNGIMDESFASTLLEEFKNNKTRSFELSEIADHVVEFSADQYGSRFIQQKLETASVEEKNKIFPEILPHARVLMTDVFGNYVIQKFFEHGTESHRNQLANQLIGHVLPLSLQMYGCRVIQKALEVVEVVQQTQMVSELDGSVMKCVRDQNGNHVIQKCIECVPQERIQFIISAFYGQVVSLSTHPYGCRVIQRVLEHCDDAKTQSTMMDEILGSVCTLAQDQYGNYVVQHVLQHGKPEERSAIITQLAGQIVKMSQQKFASNVVEKCLTYGSPDERQILITEMLGSTDENEPLQAMMKDQFANYVVQKVLETCDDQNRELILSRIKVHLNALKRYTYGKHIVARVEKLVAAGERHMGLPSYTS